jgi:hypothetical protein
VLPTRSKHRAWQIYLQETFENKTNFFRAEEKAAETTCCLLHAGFLFGLLLDPEDGANIFLRNVNCLSVYYIALYPRRQSFRNHLCVNLLHKMCVFVFGMSPSIWRFPSCYSPLTLVQSFFWISQDLMWCGSTLESSDSVWRLIDQGLNFHPVPRFPIVMFPLSYLECKYEQLTAVRNVVTANLNILCSIIFRRF